MSRDLREVWEELFGCAEEALQAAYVFCGLSLPSEEIQKQAAAWMVSPKYYDPDPEPTDDDRFRQQVTEILQHLVASLAFERETGEEMLDRALVREMHFKIVYKDQTRFLHALVSTILERTHGELSGFRISMRWHLKREPTNAEVMAAIHEVKLTRTWGDWIVRACESRFQRAPNDPGEAAEIAERTVLAFVNNGATGSKWKALRDLLKQFGCDLSESSIERMTREGRSKIKGAKE